jgi:hypothetical protein
MLKKIKYGKILLVIFLAGLIWVWADLAQDEEYSPEYAAISVAKSANPNLWVSFNEQPTVAINKLTLRGSASILTTLQRQINNGSLTLEFFLEPEIQQITEPGTHTLTVIDLLRKSDLIRQRALTVSACEPEKVNVNVVKLVKKTMTVGCVDEAQKPVKTATITPSNIEMFVPESWEGEKLTAIVQLSRREIEQARLDAVRKIPYIELAQNQIRESQTTVKITMSPEEDPLADYTLTTATLGISLSAILQGKFDVQVENLDEVLGTIAIRATVEARRAYEATRYQVILEIDDDDAKTQNSLRRELVYNFPPEYARTDEIALNQKPVVARFKLFPLTPQ